ncbi:MAG: phytanoyl-CoA dioxygenase family protein [Minwuiales bacterium]|nr:phytanoyl-CoA dioxygenase family protein [Minwuiales bacterium]
MRLTNAQRADLDRDGYLVLPDLFSPEEIGVLRASVPALMAETCDDNTHEADGEQVRNMLGLHRRNPLFGRLARHPRLLEPALQILGEDVYLQQCKINVKAGFGGGGFDWHTDFATHHSRDGVPRPLALNLHVFLDDVSEFNGPLYFAPGSHKMDVRAERSVDGEKWELWTIPDAEVARVIGTTGLVSITGGRGTGVIFGDRLLHGSPENMSPWSRWIYSSIVNPVSNRPTKRDLPQRQHEQDFAPLQPLPDDCLAA